MTAALHRMNLAVQYDADRQILELRLNRPAQRNALTRALLEQLAVELDRAAAAPPRLAVLSAEGPAFCAGMDLREMEEAAARDDREQIWRADADAYGRVVRLLWQFPAPTIALVDGPAVAGGVGLVCACDVVLASAAAWFQLPEAIRGITASLVTPLLVRRVGLAAATDLLVGGAVWPAARAREVGLVHDLAGDSAGLAALFESRCAAILQQAPRALRETKRWLLECAGRPDEALETAAGLSAASRATDEARAGLKNRRQSGR
jgi:methylglutaconyl-CoA hydratase